VTRLQYRVGVDRKTISSSKCSSAPATKLQQQQQQRRRRRRRRRRQRRRRGGRLDEISPVSSLAALLPGRSTRLIRLALAPTVNAAPRGGRRSSHAQSSPVIDSTRPAAGSCLVASQIPTRVGPLVPPRPPALSPPAAILRVVRPPFGGEVHHRRIGDVLARARRCDPLGSFRRLDVSQGAALSGDHRCSDTLLLAASGNRWPSAELTSPPETTQLECVLSPPNVSDRRSTIRTGRVCVCVCVCAPHHDWPLPSDRSGLVRRGADARGRSRERK